LPFNEATFASAPPGAVNPLAAFSAAATAAAACATPDAGAEDAAAVLATALDAGDVAAVLVAAAAGVLLDAGDAFAVAGVLADADAGLFDDFEELQPASTMPRATMVARAPIRALLPIIGEPFVLEGMYRVGCDAWTSANRERRADGRRWKRRRR
jgi:hypothetical protein